MRDVRAYLASARTYMGSGDCDVVDQPEPGRFTISLRTRANAMSDEEPSQSDIDEAQRVARLLASRFPTLNIAIDIIDEWVDLIVDNGPKMYRAQEHGRHHADAFGVTASDVSCMGGTLEIAFYNGIALASTRSGLVLYRNATSVFSPGGDPIPLNGLDELNSALAKAAEQSNDRKTRSGRAR
jgi:hypothetical protein